MTHPPTTQFRNPQSPIRNGFTLVELLVSISILALLISITVMGISKFRRAAWATDTSNELMTIQNAIQAYSSTFNALPGPLPNRTVGATANNNAYGIKIPLVELNAGSGDFDQSANDLRGVTGSENLVLGLMGGLWYDPGSAGDPVVYDPGYVGQGPRGLNPLSPKKYGAFLDNQNLLSWRTLSNGKKTGFYQDDAGKANDSIVPELVDRFPQGMPILYLRADKGAAWNATLAPSPTNQINNIITEDGSDDPATHVAQYHLKHIKGYTNTSIGEGKTAVNGSYTHGLTSVTLTANLTGKGPYDAYPYLKNPSLSTVNPSAPTNSGDVAQKKDDYILISPGIDRIYGTRDDITSFGSVGE